MYKLINPDGVIHNFTKMSRGHNIEGSDDGVPVRFEEMETRQYNWTVFHYLPIHTGDMIKRNMNSGKVGIYEVVSASNTVFRGTSFPPKDCYDITANFCGYIDKATKTITIFTGYGIEKSILNNMNYNLLRTTAILFGIVILAYIWFFLL